MPYAALKSRLDKGEIVLMDGATGTELQRRGVVMEPTAWCGDAALQGTDALRQVHLDYVTAGAEVITANTFATSRIVLNAAGLADRYAEINEVTLTAALAVREQHPDVLIGGSISHMTPRRDQHGEPDLKELAEAQMELADTLKTAGVDLILLEMMFTPERLEASFQAAKSTGLPVWAGFSARRGKDRGRGGEVLCFSQNQDIPLIEAVSILPDYDIAAAGIMHSESEVTGDALDVVRQVFDGPLTAYPDSGHMILPDWQFEEVIPAEDFVDFARGWKSDGVQIFGGCCGLGPAHIEALGVLREPAED
ncbi:MAG: homocysteine S-methyltransferase family protein [Pseudomonadota bacterium]